MKPAFCITPTRETFREQTALGNLIPIYTELVADVETPVSAFQKLDDGGYSFLLESAEQHDQTGRYSFIGTRPRILFRAEGRSISITENGETQTFETTGDPLSELQTLMQRYRPLPLEGHPRFVGGAVGYLGYDNIRFFEPTTGNPPPDVLGLPEALFMITHSIVIFDHRLRRIKVVANAFAKDPTQADQAYDEAIAEIHRLLDRLQQPIALESVPTHITVPETEPASNTTKEQFKQMVSDAQEYIRAGDIFQVVLSQRFEIPYSGDPLSLYRSLRFVNPSPYLFCLRFGSEFALVGSSPEVHVRAMDGNIEIRPIAGTRRRGETPEQDQANAEDLLGDPKERAEHVMLVDLARNDVGRIAEFSTAKVTDFMTIERYSHVMHIVSNVVGSLKKEANAYDVMRATFPAGTVSGSPKVRAMQIIHQMEVHKRGAYAGAVGYFGFDGNLDSCITLRSVVLKNGKAYVQAGAGIVADSVPESEYQETVNKAMGMVRAIERANQCHSES